MQSELTFCYLDDAVMPETEVCQKLAGALGVPHSEVHCEGAGRFAFGETGISVTLVFDEDQNPTVATAILSHDAAIKHVTGLCRAFRAMGWDF